MSVLETERKDFEKTYYLKVDIPFLELSKKFSNDSFYSFKVIREKKNNDNTDYLEIFRFQPIETKLENSNFQNLKINDIFNSFPNQQSQDFNFSIEKNSEYFVNNNVKESFCGKRRTRRKFRTDGERKYARLLKNRRTAEESRQRRIQKMKELENYTAHFEEAENKLKEEINYLKNQLSFQAEEIQYLKNQNANQAEELFNLKFFKAGF